MEIGSAFFYEKINIFLQILKSDQALKNTEFQRTVEKLYGHLERFLLKVFENKNILVT